MTVYERVYEAVKQLGYKRFKLEVLHRDCHYYNVNLDNKHFGVWDDQKRTFVD